jgi:phosphatidylglycerophosphate synthase
VVASLWAFLGWQLAYSFDCADGQLARATRQTSRAGAAIDLLGDFVVQTAVIVTFTSFASRHFESQLVLAGMLVAAGGWLLPVLWQAMASNLSPAPRPRPALLVRVLGNLRDYGLHITLLSVALLVHPIAVIVVFLSVAGLHYLFLARAYFRLWCSSEGPEQ